MSSISILIQKITALGNSWTYNTHNAVEAIRFSCDTDVLLGGIGLYGGRGHYHARIKVNYTFAFMVCWHEVKVLICKTLLMLIYVSAIRYRIREWSGTKRWAAHHQYRRNRIRVFIEADILVHVRRANSVTSAWFFSISLQYHWILIGEESCLMFW